MVKSKRKRLVERLDATCRLAVKLRDDYTCQYCGKRNMKDCHWSHIIAGRGYFLRWNMLNSMVKCYHCHRWLWHAGKINKDGWFKKKFPARWNYLHGYQNDQKGMFMPRCNIVWKYTDVELEEILENLKQKVIDLKGK